MAIRFTHRGKTWEADTAKEAVRLRDELDSMEFGDDWEVNGEKILYSIRDRSPWTPDVFWSFVRSIGEHQKRAVVAMLRHSMYADKLAAAIGIDEQSLGGVLSGLSKQLKRLNLRPFDLYYVHTDWSNNTRRRLFILETGFPLTAEEMDWPDKATWEKDATPTKQRSKRE